MKAYLDVSRMLFAVIALLHLARFLLHWPVVIGSTPVPLWASALGFILAAGLSLWGSRVARGLSA